MPGWGKLNQPIHIGPVTFRPHAGRRPPFGAPARLKASLGPFRRTLLASPLQSQTPPVNMGSIRDGAVQEPSRFRPVTSMPPRSTGWFRVRPALSTGPVHRKRFADGGSQACSGRWVAHAVRDGDDAVLKTVSEHGRHERTFGHGPISYLLDRQAGRVVARTLVTAIRASMLWGSAHVRRTGIHLRPMSEAWLRLYESEDDKHHS